MLYFAMYLLKCHSHSHAILVTVCAEGSLLPLFACTSYMYSVARSQFDQTLKSKEEKQRMHGVVSETCHTV